MYESLINLWFAASDSPGSNGTSLLIPAHDFGNAAVRHSELAGDDTRSDAVMGHLHNLVPNMVGKRSTVDENTTKLVHATLP